MFHSPKNTRSKAKGNSQPSIIVNKKKVSNGKKSMNETFEMTSEIISETPVIQKDVPVLRKFLDKKELQKLSADEKISLVVDRAVDVINSFNSMKETIEKYEKAIERLFNENSILAKENTLIKEKMGVLESALLEKENLSRESEPMMVKYERVKQQLKNDECEFWGVDEIPEENLFSTVIDIAKKFNTDVSTNDIVFVSRRTSKISKQQNIPRVIRVKFYNRFIRDKLVYEGRSLRIPRSNLVNEKNGRDFIYINEALTKHNEFLYGKTRELKRKRVISRTWCKQGRVYIQKGNDPPRVIDHVKDLNDYE